MTNTRESREQLAAEVAALRAELAILEESKGRREQVLEALSASETRFRHFIEQSIDGIVLTNEQGLIFVWNKGQERITGLKLEDTYGRAIWDVQFELMIDDDRKTPDRREEIRGQIRQFLTTGESPWGEEPQPIPIQRPDGSQRVIRAMPFPIKTANGYMAGSIIHDITDAIAAEQALQNYNDRLEILHEIDRAILAARSPQEIAEASLDHIRKLTGCRRASVSLFNLDAGTMFVMSADLNHGTDLPAGTTMPLAKFESMEELRKGKVRVVHDIEASPEPSPGERHLLAEGIRSYANIPIICDQTLIGSLNLGMAEPGSFQEEHARVASRVADSLAVAMRQTRLQQDVERRVAELEALRQASLSVTSSLNLEDVLHAIVVSAFDLLDEVQNAHIFLYQGGRIVFGAAHWSDGRRSEPFSEPRPDGLTYTVARRGTPIFVPDMRDHPLFADAPPEWEGSIIGLPLKIGERVVGVMNISRSKPRVSDETELRALGLLADQAAIAIENARLYAAVNRRHHILTTLRRVSSRSMPERDPYQLLQAVVDGLSEEFNYPIVGLLLADDATRELKVAAASGPFMETLKVDLNYQQSYDVGVMGWVVRHGEPRLVRDTDQDPDYVTSPEGPRLASELAIPIHQHGKVIGVLNIESTKKYAFDEFDLEAMLELAEELATRLENATLYHQVERHAIELEHRVRERTAELHAANQHLQALSRLKDEFVTNVSHEFRTPIASLKLYHDLLTANPEKAGDYLETLQRETDRLEHIVEDLLLLSRLDQRREHIRLSEVDLTEIVKQYMADRPLLAESRGLKLQLEEPADLPTVQGDEGLLGQALSILLTNALNYTPAGGEVLVRTATRTEDENQWVGFSVSDTGLGISPEEQEQLFERFFRGQAASLSGTPGTGLGLAIVREIVDYHGGKVEVESEGVPGKGSTFFVWLPQHPGS